MLADGMDAQAGLTDVEERGLVDFIAKIDGWERRRALSNCRRDDGKANERLESVSQHCRRMRAMNKLARRLES